MLGALQAIWWLSVALAALSCGVLASLIVARLARGKRDRDLPARSVQLTLDLLAHAKGEAPAPRLIVGNRRECDFLMRTAIDVSRALQGEYLDRLRRLLRSACLDVYYRRAAMRGHIPDRVVAVEFLYMFGDPETSCILTRLQTSSTFRICIAALRTGIALGEIPELQTVLNLAERPEGGRSLSLFKVVEASVHANLPIALALLATGQQRDAQVMVLKAIGTSRSPMALTAITRSASDIDPEVRAAAITALRAFGSRMSAPLFITALSDPDWRVRLKAVEGLGQFGEPEDRALIAPLLDDSVWWIRFRAEEAIRQLNQSVGAATQARPAAVKTTAKTSRKIAAAKPAGKKASKKATEAGLSAAVGEKPGRRSPKRATAS